MVFTKARIIFAGPVSAGKSTLLNAVMRKTLTEMNRRKTTMLPQEYVIEAGKSMSSKEIFELNRKSNDAVLKARESGEFNPADFKELIHYVEPIEEFINVPEGCQYSIIDMPGLNCGGGDDMYFNYIDNNSANIDIYILVFDINSGLNTTDEINILKRINDAIKKSGHGFVHVVINKCDDITFTNLKFEFDEIEMKELYDRCVSAINDNLKDVRGKVTISPLCSSELYVYRTMKYDLNSIEEKHLDRLIMTECGKNVLKGMKSLKEKRQYMEGKMAEDGGLMYKNGLDDTGYSLFQHNLQKIFELENYFKIVNYRINFRLTQMISEPILFDNTSGELMTIDTTINDLATKFNYKPPAEIIAAIKLINDRLNAFINSGIDSYIAGEIGAANLYIDKMTNFINSFKSSIKTAISSVFKPTKDNIIKKRYELLNIQLSKGYDANIYAELVAAKQLDIHLFTKTIKASIECGDDAVGNAIKLITTLRAFGTVPLDEIIDVLCSDSDWWDCSHSSVNRLITLLAEFNFGGKLIDMVIRVLLGYVDNLNETERGGMVEHINAYIGLINNNSIEVGYILSRVKYNIVNNVEYTLHPGTFGEYVNTRKFMEQLVIVLFAAFKASGGVPADVITDVDESAEKVEPVQTTKEEAIEVYRRAQEAAKDHAAKIMGAVKKKAASKK